MSSKSDSGSEDVSMVYESQGRRVNGEQYDEDVCRDFMRSVCTRGKRCRYRHPVVEDRQEPPPQQQQQQQQQPPPRRDITFCHDYQNNGCTRPNCKFLHCSRDEEDYFHRTGLLPSRLNHAYPSAALIKAELPQCRDYLNGDCKRGSKCKYRHIKGDHESDRKSRDYDRRDDRIYDHGPDTKRRRMDDLDYDRDRTGLSYTYLEDENNMLKRKVEELKKQVSDLTAINEVLLEQNARYRVSKATAMQVPNSQQTLTAVAMAASPASPAVPPAPVHAQATLTQLNSSLTQQVALNSDLATQHALQTAQRMAASGGLGQSRSAQSAMAAASLNPTVTVTMTQNLAGPLALSQSNLAVSMAPMRPAPQLHVAHSLTQNLGAPTSLVSYPIMSQNMRSAVEPSSLTH